MSKSVLVVDDAMAVCKSVRRMLHDLGIQDVDLAVSVDDALASMARRDYGLVIIDCFLDAGHTGLELLAEMKHRFQEVPSMIMTGDIHRAEREFGRSVEILRKPFNKEQLQSHIERFID